jgi:type II pantothenate kinase
MALDSPTSLATLAAIDFGITNIDAILRRDGELIHTCLPTGPGPLADQFAAVLQSLYASSNCPVERVAVTGGRYRSLPKRIGEVELVKVSEVSAIGRGGLYLAGMDEALVVSAGSGTAMVAARRATATHVTGSAVGGGTLQGLGRLLLGTPDAIEIDRLAMLGNANAADLTLVEAVGSAVGKLPVDANAVNFGRLATEEVHLSRPDLAAGLVRLVGQVIAVIAINAARAEGLEQVVVTGHLVDLASVRRVLDEVAGYYRARISVPAQPGIGSAVGALLCLEDPDGRLFS